MSLANDLEQLMLSLINEERSNADLAPLTFNNDLNEASEDHSTWMLDTDTFSHTGEGGSSAGDRIVEAGYELEGNWTWGENIGWQSERGAPGLEDDVRDIHESLMNSPGHRANILNPSFEEIGIGIERGDFDRFDSVMITQNFGATDAVSEDGGDTPVADDPANGMPDDQEPPVADDPTEDEPPVAEGPDNEDPAEEEPPVAEGPDEEDEDPDPEDPPVAEGPDQDDPEAEEPPVAEGPSEDDDNNNQDPDPEDPPVAEGPDEDDPEAEEPPVAEDPDAEIPDEEPPVAEGPDPDMPEDEPPVAEDPTNEDPDEDEPPVAEGPDEDGFDVEQFLADLSDLLDDIFDNFEFIASDDCAPDDMVIDMPIDEDTMDDEMSADDDMVTSCGDWPVDDFDFEVSVNISLNFDLA